MEFRHTPVMFDECMSGLDLKRGGVYFDGTLGGGGHSYGILSALGAEGRLIATDLDGEAIAAADKKLKPLGKNYTLLNDNYKNIIRIAKDLGITAFDGILLDLGISSYQLDNRDRGFSYLAPDKPLDMRMDARQTLTAATVVNQYEKERLEYILSAYGEERFAARIASAIVAARANKPVETAGELVEIIEKCIPAKYKQDGHPAKRTFQAIRIEVNGELDGLGECLKEMVGLLKSGGRIAVITFHSLEDRIVKQCFKDLETDCICDKRLPVCVCGKKKVVELITRKPVTASDEELARNPRAKSAKLRIARKI